MNGLQHTRNEQNPCLKQNRPDRTYRDTLNFVAHEPSAESTVNKNNTIFPITEQLLFIMTLFDRSVTYVQRLIGHSILGD